MDKLKIVQVKPQAFGGSAEIRTIENDLDHMREIVGGWIETFALFKTGKWIYFAVINEEGRLLDLPLCRVLNGQYIAGEIFITKTGLFGGDFVSLTDQEAEKIRNIFQDHGAIFFE